jgi:hypothetical protein
MGSKTERGLQSASIHPSFPTQTTSLVAKLRLNPKPTIPIVGRVRTKNHITRRNATFQKIASLKKYSFPRTDPIHALQSTQFGKFMIKVSDNKTLW